MMLSLVCYLLGDNVKRYFIVKIEETETVSILKDLIKEKKAPHLDHLAASDLDVWKVNLPISNLKQSLGKIELDDDSSLSQSHKLSQVFSTPLVSELEHVHIVIKSPSVDKVRLVSLRYLMWDDHICVLTFFRLTCRSTQF